MKKRVCVFIAAFVLVVSVMAPTVSAATCPITVSNKVCGNTVSSVFQGNSSVYSASHKYGGFLGIGQSTCNYNYYYSYYANKCSSGHTLGTYSNLWETGHDC